MEPTEAKIPFTVQFTPREMERVNQLAALYSVSKAFIVRVAVQQACKLDGDRSFAQLLQVTTVNLEDDSE